jgi:hypothetical protein
MVDDTANEKETPSTTDEAQDKEDVEGHSRHLRPEGDVSARKSTEDDKADPGKPDPPEGRFI